MRIISTLLLLTAISLPAQAEHSWSTYHWHTDSLPLTVEDDTSSQLYDVPAGVAEWSDLNTPVGLSMVGSNADVTVVEGFNPRWLGLAQVYLSDGHIIEGQVKLNTKLLMDYGPDVADHVLCQELGHILGLDHNRVDLDTCMNDTTAVSNTAPWPNLHDEDELNLIYNHLDVVIPPADEPTSPFCNKRPDHPKCSSANGWYIVHAFPAP